jgi:hypothetical protein
MAAPAKRPAQVAAKIKGTILRRISYGLLDGLPTLSHSRLDIFGDENQILPHLVVVPYH